VTLLHGYRRGRGAAVSPWLLGTAGAFRRTPTCVSSACAVGTRLRCSTCSDRRPRLPEAAGASQPRLVGRPHRCQGPWGGEEAAAGDSAVPDDREPSSRTPHKMCWTAVVAAEGRRRCSNRGTRWIEWTSWKLGMASTDGFARLHSGLRSPGRTGLGCCGPPVDRGNGAGGPHTSPGLLRACVGAGVSLIAGAPRSGTVPRGVMRWSTPSAASSMSIWARRSGAVSTRSSAGSSFRGLLLVVLVWPAEPVGVSGAGPPRPGRSPRCVPFGPTACSPAQPKETSCWGDDASPTTG
jgi:hypothetical protein